MRDKQHEKIDQLCIHTTHTLSMDSVQQANSGYPGTPMAMAQAAYCLWNRFLRFEPNDPICMAEPRSFGAFRWACLNAVVLFATSLGSRTSTW